MIDPHVVTWEPDTVNGSATVHGSKRTPATTTPVVMAINKTGVSEIRPLELSNRDEHAALAKSISSCLSWQRRNCQQSQSGRDGYKEPC